MKGSDDSLMLSEKSSVWKQYSRVGFGRSESVVPRSWHKDTLHGADVLER